MSEFVVITGLSGAGRSQAADHLEDMGWFVIDNVPAALIPKLAELLADPGSTHERAALVVRTGDYDDEIRPALDALRNTAQRVRILFLDAATDVLVRRYENTRRRHPVGGASLEESIELERQQLEPLKAEADVVVDTSDLNVHQLRAWIVELFAADSADAGLQVSVVSFGYKHGVPIDVDMVFDGRFLPNPHWVEDLRPLTGRDEPVRDYVLGQPEAREFLSRLDHLFELLVPAFVREGKSYLRIAVGCTGGRHRSVVIAEELAGCLREHGLDPTVLHRDVDR
ncbi:MAG TPA: RNase adapter RapZ [Acidimicrobiales bacterium]|nr:RNase adapter RapZ [Acidimicrobiales bacterium]